MKREKIKAFLDNVTSAPVKTPVYATHYHENTPGIYSLRAFTIDRDCYCVLAPRVLTTATIGAVLAICERRFDRMYLTLKKKILRPVSIDYGIGADDKEMFLIHYMDEVKDKPEDVEVYLASHAEQLEGQAKVFII